MLEMRRGVFAFLLDKPLINYFLFFSGKSEDFTSYRQKEFQILRNNIQDQRQKQK